MSSATSVIATLTCSGTASALVSNLFVWYFLVTVVPFLVVLLAEHPRPTTR